MVKREEYSGWIIMTNRPDGLVDIVQRIFEFGDGIRLYANIRKIDGEYIIDINPFLIFRSRIIGLRTNIDDYYALIDTANEIYKKYKELNIRAGGHCGNEPPITQSYNPIYEKEMEEYRDKVGLNEFIKTCKDVIHDDGTQPRFVDTYYIDTQLGLCKLAETIINKNVTCEMKNFE